MFVPIAVRKRVIEKMAVMKTVSEEQIHELYHAEMCKELERCDQAAAYLVRLPDHVECYSPKSGWVMLSRKILNDHIEALQNVMLCIRGYRPIVQR